MASKRDEAPPESDRFLEFCLPRENPHCLGHDAIEKELFETFRTGYLPHAFLIGGPVGIGKATLAWRFARFLLIHSGPANVHAPAAKNFFVPPEHHVFRQAATLAHGDIFLLRREWNEKTKSFFTNIRVEDVRRISHLFHQSSSAGGYRICIVDAADDLNLSSANALLKLIEEPPPYALFLIVAHRPGQVLPTIRSRCRKLSLNLLSNETIGQILRLPEVGVEATDSNLSQALLRANGSVHDVLTLLDGEVLRFDSALNLLLEALPHLDYASLHKLADQIAGRDREDAYELLLARVFEWLSFKVHASQHDAPQKLAPFAGVWEKLGKMTRDTGIYNLDKRPLVLAMFQDLAWAVKMAGSIV